MTFVEWRNTGKPGNFTVSNILQDIAPNFTKKVKICHQIQIGGDMLQVRKPQYEYFGPQNVASCCSA
jgi:hypothetical protein